MQSRLTRRSTKQNKNQLYGSLAAIIVIIFAALTFGPFLLGATGTFIDRITGKTGDSAKIVTNADIQAPSFDPIPEATPSATITISGTTAYRNGSVELYVNNNLSDQVEIDSSQDFEFTDVKLREGTNSIRARVTIGDKKGEFSQEEFIKYSKGEPKLEISSPTDRQGFSKADKQITVRGTTDSENSVTVNGFTAIVDSSGNFSYDLNLNNGDNKLTVIATAPSGQTKTTELTVTYSEN